MTKKAERIVFFYRGMERLGFTYAEADSLRRIESTLHRWAERECNGEVETYDDGTACRVYQPADMRDAPRRFPTPNRKAGALRRLAAIMKRHPDLVYYHQTDPRGCALYILRQSDLLDGIDLDAQYSRGFAVCY